MCSVRFYFTVEFQCKKHKSNRIKSFFTDLLHFFSDNLLLWLMFNERVLIIDERVVTTVSADQYLHYDIFIICLPMFPPFIIEQKATPMFSIPFTTVSKTLI